MRRQPKKELDAAQEAAALRAYQDAPTVQIWDPPLDELSEESLVEMASSTHIGTRETQQDALFVSPTPLPGDIHYAILCDGMGGMAGGEMAAAAAVATVADRLKGLTVQSDIPMELVLSAQEANAVVLNLGVEGAGTTLVIAVVAGNQLFWCSVGDSRLYIYREGEMVQATRDHNYGLWLAQQVEQGDLTPAEAQEHPHREALVSFIGIAVLDLWDLSRRPFELLPGDVALLCSDGLTKSLTDLEIQTILQAPESLSLRGEQMICSALDAAQGSQDNTTVILMQYRGRETRHGTQE